MSLRLGLATFLVVGGAGPLAAQTPEAVPAAAPVRRPPLLNWREAAAMTAVLSVTLAMDGVIRADIQEHRSSLTNGAAQVGNAFGDLRYLAPVLGVGWLVGRVAGPRALERAAQRAGEAAVLASGISGVMKFGLGRVRPLHGAEVEPDHFRPLNRRGGFPSGHTTVAFAVATALARETSDGWSDAALYGLASLTAFSRLNDDVHWTSDVAAGAMVGYLVGRQIVPGRAGAHHAGAHLVVSPQGLGVSIAF